jgi:hypothetical protein
MEADIETEIAILMVPAGREVITIKQVTRAISYLALYSKRLKTIAPLEDEQNVRRFAYLRAALPWMDQELHMTPKIKRSCKLDTFFKFMFADPTCFFPEDIASKAEVMYDRWESENWGSDAVQDDGQANDDEEAEQPSTPVAPGPSTTTTTSGPGSELETTQVALPSENDPMFGVRGMMHGVLQLRGVRGRKKYQLNPKVPKQAAQVYGHNGIEVGAWYPLQVRATLMRRFMLPRKCLTHTHFTDRRPSQRCSWCQSRWHCWQHDPGRLLHRSLL